MKMRSSLCWLPILLALFTAIAFTSSYVISVLRGDVNALWPYISDTGTDPPESCIFGQFLNFTAMMAMATMYVRYKLVQAFNNHDIPLRRLNQIALFFGACSSLGVSLVANFQEKNVISVHIIGAMMAFVLGTVYCFIQTGITKKMHPMYNSLSIWVWRLIISLVGMVSLICTGIFGAVATYEAGPNKTAFDNLKWNSTEPGYDAHIASTVSEWFIGIAFVAFFLTYIKDFQKITMKILPELLVSHLDETPIIFTHAGPTERTGLLA